MFLVVESGSTKADWMLIDNDKHSAYSTKGFNPYFHSQEDILIELNEHLELDLIKDRVQEIFFYGAGCSSNVLNNEIQTVLETFFINAKVTVDHDLAACAFACYNDTPQIACILGTGSNSCHYDGKTISEAVPALSYILGDEGSGSYFGKALLSGFLYKKLPNAIHQELSQMGLTKDQIFESVYRKPNANVYIASFTQVLIRNKDLEYSQRIIKEGFQKFIDIHVKCFPDYKKCEVNFVGSVASLLQKELKEVCAENEITIGTIVRRPLERLVAYHKNLKGLSRTNFIKEDTSRLN